MFWFREWIKYILAMIVVSALISAFSDTDTSKIVTYVFGIGVIFGVLTVIARHLSKKHEKRKTKRIELEWAVTKEREKMRKKELAQKARKHVIKEDHGVDYNSERE